MMMVIRVFPLLILSLSIVAEDNHHDVVMHFSKQQPHSQVLHLLSSNSSEDYLKYIGNFIPKIIKGTKTIIHKGETTVGLGSNKKNLRLGASVPSKTSAQKRGSISLDIPPLPPPPSPPPPSPPPPPPPPPDPHKISATYGFNFLEGAHKYPMEDYIVSRFNFTHDTYDIIKVFAIFDGYLTTEIPAYLERYLFKNIITSHAFSFDIVYAMIEGYRQTNKEILEKAKLEVSFGGSCASTAVTAMLLRHFGQSKFMLVVGNVGDSRAVISDKNGVAIQLSVDHVPSNPLERVEILKRGGHVRKSLGHGPSINGTFPLSRAFGGMSYSHYISCDPHVRVLPINGEIEFLVLASHPLWNVMTNQQVVNSIREIENPWEAATYLTQHAVSMPGYHHQDDISCVVIRFP